MNVRAVLPLAAAAAGYGAAGLLGIDGVADSGVYQLAVTALLALGLFAAAHGIDLREARAHLRTVLLAVTAGVVAKVALISAVVVPFYGEPEMVLLAVAVAQIDPLSVAALRQRTRLSPAGKTLLSAWASFDDPVTVLLTVYLAAYALPEGSLGGLDTGFAPFLTNLALNLLVAGLAYLAWRAYSSGGVARAERVGVPRRWRRVAVAVLLAAFAVLVVWQALLLCMAFLGLFVRPGIDRAVDRLAETALYLAAFAIGLVVVLDRQTALIGLVLGTAAFFAQFLVALLLPAKALSSGDRLGLALAQQNGLTAIVLALLLEPGYPGAAGIIACAVVTVNVIHAVAGLIRLPQGAPAPLSPARRPPAPPPGPAGRADPASQ